MHAVIYSHIISKITYLFIRLKNLHNIYCVHILLHIILTVYTCNIIDKTYFGINFAGFVKSCLRFLFICIATSLRRCISFAFVSARVSNSGT